MKKENIVDFNEFKGLKEIKKTEESYARYLATLSSSQLEIEGNYLVKQESNRSKGKLTLLLKEISSRTTGDRRKIEILNDDTLRLL